MSGSFFGGKKPDPKEQVKEWKASLRKELRGLDRQVLNIEREEMKIKLSVREAAKKNQIDVCKVLAKSLVQSRKAKKQNPHLQGANKFRHDEHAKSTKYVQGGRGNAEKLRGDEIDDGAGAPARNGRDDAGAGAGDDQGGPDGRDNGRHVRRHGG